MMTTTASKIHHEDQSRMLILNMDYDQEAIRQALRNSAAGKTRSAVPIDLAPWHELQETLKSNPVDVQIPYGEELADYMPIGNIKVQRDFPKVLAMLRACALVHQNERERDREGGVIANESDYRAIYDLLNTPLSQGLEADVSPGVREVIEAVLKLQEGNNSPYNEGISQSRLAEILKKDRSSVLRNIHSAIGLGYLINTNPGKGREARIILGERKLSSESALPHPDLLFGDIPAEQVHRCTTDAPRLVPNLERDLSSVEAAPASTPDGYGWGPWDELDICDLQEPETVDADDYPF